jgi:7-cyano-7-deazaguanine synthase
VAAIDVSVRDAQPRPEVLVLLSGGIDSAACLDFYLDLGRAPCALFVDHGQPAATHEERAARAMASHYGVPIACLKLKGARPKSSGLISGRNAFLMIAALMERPPSVSVIATGIHAGTGYSDCSKDFVARMQALLDVYAEGVQVAAPFLDWAKPDVIEYCFLRGVPIDLTYSCERGLVPPCGSCLSCMDREALDASA